MTEPDPDVIERIERLAHEEHQLFERESRGEASTRQRARLKEIQDQLDECYELLRRRRAMRAAGLEQVPAAASPAADLGAG
ncbi:MAG TPA: DUF2630 family protein [Actinomycetota bacterium]|nr:DUF2630 family protein [Actinomycetota bacterium]